MKRIYLSLSLLALNQLLVAQTPRQLENIEAFNRLYGYVKYFHPSDEAAELNWSSFAICGIGLVEKCKDANELQATLSELFRPIAPTVKIFSSSSRESFSQRDITPQDKVKYNIVTWQHLGLGTGESRNVYASARLNAKSQESGPLFENKCTAGEYIQKEIGSGLMALVPLALYGNESGTYPKSDSTKYAELQKKINFTNTIKIEDLYVRLGDLIIVWNVFQHFYPYFDVTKTNWEEAFIVAVGKAYTDRTEYDFLTTLREFTAKLKDGHVSVFSRTTFENENFLLPIGWEWIEGRLVITRVMEAGLPVIAGEIVTAIDGKSAREYFAKVYAGISAATPGSMEFQAQTRSIAGTQFSKVQLTISGEHGMREETMVRTVSYAEYYRTSGSGRDEPLRKLSNNIYYVDIGRASMDQIKSKLSDIQHSKALICDLRGYPNRNHDLIRHLLQKADTSKRWMRVPEIIYPDQEKIVGYKEFGWGMTPLEPHLDLKVYFIVDGRAISYAESFMGFIEHYKLATIVGQPTAGTNGNVNKFWLPGNYNISWTGMKVVKHDGSQLHGIGIIPSVYVQKTIEGVKQNKDEFLDKAIELASKNN